MNKRPVSVTVIGCIFIAAGVIGFVYHLPEFKTRSFDYGIVGISVARLVAVVGGAFVLRGHNWARWLLLVWIAFHVVLSAFHSMSQLVTHALLFAVVAYVLFRPQASAYFRSAGAESAQTP
jgi:tryptophan-rich sensory protein